jgi:hypothetical protein
MKPCTLILDNNIKLEVDIESLPKIRENNTCDCLTVYFKDIETFQQFIDLDPKDLKLIVKYDVGICTIKIYDIFEILKNNKDLSVIVRFKEMLNDFE